METVRTGSVSGFKISLYCTKKKKNSVFKEGQCSLFVIDEKEFWSVSIVLWRFIPYIYSLKSVVQCFIQSRVFRKIPCDDVGWRDTFKVVHTSFYYSVSRTIKFLWFRRSYKKGLKVTLALMWTWNSVLYQEPVLNLCTKILTQQNLIFLGGFITSGFTRSDFCAVLWGSAHSV